MNALPPDLPRDVHALRGGAFGDRGTLVFAAEFNFGASHELSLQPDFAGTASLSPSLEAFVVPHVSLGAALGFAFASGDGSHASGIDAWPRAGVAFALSRDVVFWPRAGVDLSSVTITSGSVTTKIEGAALALYAPLVLLPLPHIEIGFGPTFLADFARRQSGGGSAPQGTSFGLAIEIGGWL